MLGCMALGDAELGRAELCGCGHQGGMGKSKEMTRQGFVGLG